MEFDQAGFGVEESHVEHDVLTCVLQQLVSSNKQMVLQFVSNLFYKRFSLEGRSISQ